MTKRVAKRDLPTKVCAVCWPPFHMAAEMGGELGRGALLLGPLPARQGAAYCAACWSFGGALNCCVQRAFVESTTVTLKGLPASGL